MNNGKLGRGVRAGCWMLVLAVAGCGVSSSGEGTSLDGRTFLLESAEGFTAVSGTVPRIRFESTELTISAGCNSQGGNYSVRGGRLVVRGLGSTEVGCDLALHSQDQWLADFITSSPRVMLDGDRLTLTGDDATLVFLDREIADPDLPLEGTVWIVDTIIANGGASSIAGNSPPELSFDQTSTTWNAFSGCFTFAGDYSVQGDMVSIDSTVLTGCEEELGPIELHIQAMFADGPITFEITADSLRLTRGSLGIGAHAE